MAGFLITAKSWPLNSPNARDEVRGAGRHARRATLWTASAGRARQLRAPGGGVRGAGRHVVVGMSAAVTPEVAGSSPALPSLEVPANTRIVYRGDPRGSYDGAQRDTRARIAALLSSSTSSSRSSSACLKKTTSPVFSAFARFSSDVETNERNAVRNRFHSARRSVGD